MTVGASQSSINDDVYKSHNLKANISQKDEGVLITFKSYKNILIEWARFYVYFKNNKNIQLTLYISRMVKQNEG